MLSRLFLVVVAYSWIECDATSVVSGYSSNAQFQYQVGGFVPQNQNSGSQNQNPGPQNQNPGSQNPNYGPRITDATLANMRQYMVPPAVISSAAMPVSYAPLEVLVTKKLGQLVTTNDGSFVTSVPANLDDILATLTGGPAGNATYNFFRVAQNQDQYPNNTHVSATIDGEGWPGQFQIFFYKAVYETYTNALNYLDGLILLIFDIIVQGEVPNPLFEPFRSVLEQVAKPNSTANTTMYAATNWLLSTVDTGFYVYNGSFIVFATGLQIPCATLVQGRPNKLAWVSYPQYSAFLNLLNKNNQPLTNPLGLFSLADRFLGQASSPYIYRCND